MCKFRIGDYVKLKVESIIYGDYEVIPNKIYKINNKSIDYKGDELLWLDFSSCTTTHNTTMRGFFARDFDKYNFRKEKLLKIENESRKLQ